MDYALKFEQSILERGKPISEAIARGVSAIQKFYKSSKIFITGGSGFIGKLIIEKLFRSCAVDTVYVLIRPKKNVQPKERLSEILKDPVFDGLHKDQPDFVKKIIAVEGDLGELNIGISEENWNTLTDEVDVIFHVAANVKFDVALKDAVLSNVRGTREALRLGRACKKLRAFVHVSTAYTHATKSRENCSIPEKFHESPAPPKAMIELAESLDTEKMDRIAKCFMDDWANSYTLSKAIADEVVLSMSDGMPVCIVKPAIVISTYHEPSPGWVDSSNVYGPTGVLLGTGLGVVHTILEDKSKRIDFVPADMVTNAVIAAAWDTAKNRDLGKEPKIFTITGGRKQQTWGDYGRMMRNIGPNFASPKIVYYPCSIETKYKFVCLLLTWLVHYIPAYIIDGICMLAGKERRFVKLYTKFYKITEVFSFFTLKEWFFNNENTQKLLMDMSEIDKVIFNFDTDSIDKEEMFCIWMVGTRKYIIKDGLKDTDYGVKKIFYFKFLHYTILTVYIFCWWKVLVFLFAWMHTVFAFFVIYKFVM